MKLLIAVLLALPLLLLFPGDLVADDEKPEDGGGGIFDDPGKEDSEEEGEPEPATFAFKDYRLEMSVEDGRFWKQDLNFTEDELNKYNMVLKLQFKLPKSESFFDVRITAQGWSHKSQFDFDGLKVGAANYSKLCDVFFEQDMKEWKDIKDPEKPKKSRLFRKLKAVRYALTGTPPGSSMPFRQERYLFKFGDKTYSMVILYSTTAARTERITTEVENMLKTLQERKSGRR